MNYCRRNDKHSLVVNSADKIGYATLHADSGWGDMNRVHRLLMIGVLLLPGAWSPAMAQDQDLPSGYVSIAPLVVPVVDNFRMPAVLMTRLTIEARDRKSTRLNSSH